MKNNNKNKQIKFVVGNQPYRYDPIRGEEIKNEILYCICESCVAFRDEIKRLSKK